MDMWRYYEITHGRHDVMNPSSPERLDEMGRMLRLQPGQRMVDVGCGHGELLLRWHRNHGISGIGIDASPYHAKRATERVEKAGATDAIQILHQKGEAFESDETFDIAACLGASWIYGGHGGTLDALRRTCKPGGLIVVGEPYWIEEPPQAYLDAEDLTRDQFTDLVGCYDAATKRGLELVWMTRSSSRDWDRYEMLQCAALDEYAATHPDDPDLDDPDLDEIRRTRHKYNESYFRWGHACLGWALWAFRTPTSV